MPDPDLRRHPGHRWAAAALVAVLVAGLAALPTGPVGVAEARTPPDRVGSRGVHRPDHPTDHGLADRHRPDDPRQHGPAARPGLRSRRRDEPVRRPRPGPRRPAGRAHPGPLLPRHGARRGRRSDTPIRVRLFEALATSASKPLVLVARGDAWTIDGVATVFPRDARLEARPTVSGSSVSWRVKVIAVGRHGPARRADHHLPRPRPVHEHDLRGRGQARHRRSLSRRHPGRAAGHGDHGQRDQRAQPGAVPARRGPGRDAIDLAGRGAPGPGHRRPFVRGPPAAPGDLVLRCPRRLELAGLPGHRGREGLDVGRGDGHGRRGPPEGLGDRQRDVPLDRWWRHRGQRERVHERVRRRSWRARSATCAAAPTGAPMGRPTTPRPRTRRGRPRPTPGRPCRRCSRPTAARTSGTLTALDLTDRGVGGRLRSVTLIGSSGTKQVSGDVFRAVFNARRPAGDPLLRSTLFDTMPIP